MKTLKVLQFLCQAHRGLYNAATDMLQIERGRHGACIKDVQCKQTQEEEDYITAGVYACGLRESWGCEFKVSQNVPI